jgi:hypothetical protein
MKKRRSIDCVRREGVVLSWGRGGGGTNDDEIKMRWFKDWQRFCETQATNSKSIVLFDFSSTLHLSPLFIVVRNLSPPIESPDQQTTSLNSPSQTSHPLHTPLKSIPNHHPPPQESVPQS